MTLVRRLTFALVVYGMSAASAQASVITLNYDFSVTGFPAGAPVDPVTGSFSVTFDTATNANNETSGISLTGLNIALGSAPVFSHTAITGELLIGGESAGAEGLLISPVTDDFLLVLDVSTTPKITALLYIQMATGEVLFTGGEGTLTPTEVGPGAVPEPASLTLLGLGLVGTGARRWRRRKASPW